MKDKKMDPNMNRREEERRRRIKRGLSEKKERVTGINTEKAKKDSSESDN